MCRRNRGQLLKRDIGDSLAYENLARANQVESLLEGHFDVIWGSDLLFFFFFDIEYDVSLEVLPFRVALLDRLVIQPEVVYDDLLDLLRIGTLQSQVEKSAFLSQEPFAQLIISAVGQPANEMRYIVVLTHGSSFCIWALFKLHFTIKTVVFSLICETMLGEVLIHCQFYLFFLVGVIPIHKFWMNWLRSKWKLTLPPNLILTWIQFFLGPAIGLKLFDGTREA